MNFRKKNPPTQTGFQMAPMIDIMFLLLIFFMTAAVYAQWEKKIGIKVPVTQTYDAGMRSEGEIIINIEADGGIFIGTAKITEQRLYNLLSDAAPEYQNQPIIIRADAETKHRDVMKIMDICRKVGIWNISFAVLPEQNAE